MRMNLQKSKHSLLLRGQMAASWSAIGRPACQQAIPAEARSKLASTVAYGYSYAVYIVIANGLRYWDAGMAYAACCTAPAGIDDLFTGPSSLEAAWCFIPLHQPVLGLVATVRRTAWRWPQAHPESWQIQS